MSFEIAIGLGGYKVDSVLVLGLQILARTHRPLLDTQNGVDEHRISGYIWQKVMSLLRLIESQGESIMVRCE